MSVRVQERSWSICRANGRYELLEWEADRSSSWMLKWKIKLPRVVATANTMPEAIEAYRRRKQEVSEASKE